MPINETPAGGRVTGFKQKLWVTVLILAVVILICSAVSVAYLFESPSIKYKFGWDKVMLRAGKMVGLAAAVLLILQLPVAGRIKFLDRIFSLPGLFQIHRYIAYVIGVLVIVHPILILIPEDRWFIPLEGRYWPEWVGVALLVAILSQIILGQWHRKFIRHYARWLLCHRIVGLVILILLAVHVLYVSETFEFEGLPRTGMIVVAVALGILWMAIRSQRIRAKRHSYEVKQVQPAGKDAYAIDLKPFGRHDFQYLPGQFAFFSFVSGRLSPEWHPFTFSSSPTRPDSLQVTIRRSGDWTDGIDGVQLGERVYVHGPFGRFSHRLEPKDREVIMIAGGIGITPMLSMLRQMSDRARTYRVTLIWSNQTAQHVFAHDEIAGFEEKLTRFGWVPIFTRIKESTGHFGRLTRDRLESLLTDQSRKAVIYLCGPPQMTQQVRNDLIAIGFSARRIKRELFGL